MTFVLLSSLCVCMHPLAHEHILMHVCVHARVCVCVCGVCVCGVCVCGVRVCA